MPSWTASSATLVEWNRLQPVADAQGDYDFALLIDDFHFPILVNDANPAIIHDPSRTTSP